MRQTKETIYEVTVRFDRSKDGTGNPSSFVNLYAKTFRSADGYDACHQQIERYRKAELNQGIIATTVLNTAEHTYTLQP